MFKRIIPVALLSSLTLIGGFALAAAPTYPSNPERNMTAQAVPVAKTRAEVLAELADFRKNPVSADRWQYVGGEHEWAPIPHTFALVNGRLEHTDVCDHMSGPSLSSIGDQKSPYGDLYKNTF